MLISSLKLCFVVNFGMKLKSIRSSAIQMVVIDSVKSVASKASQFTVCSISEVSSINQINKSAAFPLYFGWLAALIPTLPVIHLI